MASRTALPLDAVVARIASRQHGVVATAQLLEAGLTRTQIQTRARHGGLHRVHRGVYAVGHPALSHPGRMLASVMACGPGAVLAHRSAADLWGIHKYAGLPEVTVPRTGARQRRGIRVHVSATLEPGDVTTRDGIPVTTPARTVTDLADVTTRRATQRALAAAERAGLASRHDLLIPPRGRRRVVHGPHRFSRSENEERFMQSLDRWGLPLPEQNQDIGPWEVDFIWREHALVVELDDPFSHLDREAFERDRLKDEQLTDAGLEVRRITTDRLATRPGDVRAMLARRLAHQGGENPHAGA
jgi:very-short-patch-repair endonuclease